MILRLKRLDNWGNYRWFGLKHENSWSTVILITLQLFQIKDLQEQQEKERFARAISHAEKLARAEQLRDKKIAEVKRKVCLSFFVC